MIASINPTTGETLRTFDALSGAQVDAALSRADAAWRTYRHTPLPERAKWLSAAADILERGKGRLGRVMTIEMGKPIGATRAEAAKCAPACEDVLSATSVSSRCRYFRLFGPLRLFLAILRHAGLLCAGRVRPRSLPLRGRPAFSHYLSGEQSSSPCLCVSVVNSVLFGQQTDAGSAEYKRENAPEATTNAGAMNLNPRGCPLRHLCVLQMFFLFPPRLCPSAVNNPLLRASVSPW